MLAAMMTSCAPATPQVVEKKVVETVIVEKQVEKVVTPTAVPKAAGPKYGGTFVLGTPQQVTGFNPYIAQLKNDLNTWPGLYNKLVTLDRKGEVAPDLAESWDISTDGLTYTFHLRKGVKFHNGRDFKANDAKWFIEKVLDPATAAYWSSAIKEVSKAEVVDDYTLKLTLSKPSGVLLAGLTYLPVVASESWDTIDQHPIGTGPFYFVENVPNDHITLRKFKDYWKKGQPYLDEVVIKVQADPTAALTTFTTGGWDFYWQLPAKYAGLIQKAKGMRLVEPNTQTTYTLFMLPYTSRPFSDKRARQALLYAMDRETMAKVAYFGRATVPKHNVQMPSDNWSFCPGLKEYPYDLKQAKQLFAQAGVKEGDTLYFKAPAVNPEWKPISEVMERSFNEMGIKLNIELQELSAWLDLVLPAYNKQEKYADNVFTTNILDTAPDPEFNYLALRSGINGQNYSNPQLDALLDQARGIVDREARKKIYCDVEKLINDESPVAVIAFWSWTMAAQDYVQNVWVNAVGDAQYDEVWLDK